MELQFKDLGLTSYKACWDYQEELFKQNVACKSDEATRWQTTSYVLLTEHKPVFTLGKSGNYEHLIVNETLLGAEFYRINRGGDITFHGPGQLVVYPILDLEKAGMGLATYIETLEAITIALLAMYGLQGERYPGASGVWLDVANPIRRRKICAIGVRASRYITMHGLAFNVNTDLSYFTKIVPCGIADAGVCSLEKELGKPIDIGMVKQQFIELFTKFFQKK